MSVRMAELPHPRKLPWVEGNINWVLEREPSSVVHQCAGFGFCPWYLAIMGL